jgi:hypothetical protein
MNPVRFHGAIEKSIFGGVTVADAGMPVGRTVGLETLRCRAQQARVKGPRPHCESDVFVLAQGVAADSA